MGERRTSAGAAGLTAAQRARACALVGLAGVWAAGMMGAAGRAGGDGAPQRGPAGASEPAAGLGVGSAGVRSAVSSIAVYPISGVTTVRLRNGVIGHARPLTGEGPPRVHVVARVFAGAAFEGEREYGLSAAAASAWVRPWWGEPAQGGNGGEGGGGGGGRGGGGGGGLSTDAGDAQGQITVSAAMEGYLIEWEGPPGALGWALEGIAGMIASPRVDAGVVAQRRRAALSQLEAQAGTAALRAAVWGLTHPGEGVDRAPITALEVERWTPEAVGEWLGRGVRRLGGAGGATTVRVARAGDSGDEPGLGGEGVGGEGVGAPVEIAVVGDVGAQEAAQGLALAFGSLSGRGDAGRSVSAVAHAARRVHRGAGPGGPTPERVTVAGGGVGAAIGGWGPDVADLDGLRVGFVAARAIGRRCEAALRASMPGAGARAEAFVAPSQTRRGLGAMVVQGALSRGGWAEAEGAHGVLVRELLRIAREGLSPDEVRQAAAEAAADAAARLGSRAYWASVLSTSALYGHDPEGLAGALEAYGGIDAGAVNPRLERWLRPGVLGSVLYAPEAETGPAAGGGV